MKNTINTYTCSNGHVLVTRDANEGVTPFMKQCETCGQMSRSGMYQVDQSLTPTHEWYTPAHPERYEEISMRLHIKDGGLAFRAIGDPDETEAMPKPIPKVRHELKCLPEFFQDVKAGNKGFEVRKNDRNYQVGNELLLQEWSPEGGYTGDTLLMDVVYVLQGGQFGIDPEYCVMSLNWSLEVDLGDFEEPITHNEEIICPICTHQQMASVQHTFPWHTYIHDCVKCGYTIMESEWQRVKKDAE